MVLIFNYDWTQHHYWTGAPWRPTNSRTKLIITLAIILFADNDRYIKCNNNAHTTIGTTTVHLARLIYEKEWIVAAGKVLFSGSFLAEDPTCTMLRGSCHLANWAELWAHLKLYHSAHGPVRPPLSHPFDGGLLRSLCGGRSPRREDDDDAGTKWGEHEIQNYIQKK